jgi:Dolichyl-phosphate-mannose-protein mannosyltransferase
VHPPVYLIVLFIYSRIVGDTEVALRSLSALAACASILIFVAGTKRTFSLPARLFGAAIATGSLFWFFQSQNARSYAFCLLISAGILALCLSLLAEPPPHDKRIQLGGLIVLMFIGSFAHFYVMYESLAALIILALFRRHERYLMAATGGVLLMASALYVQFVMAPFSQAALGSNWYQNDFAWYRRVLRSSVLDSFGKAGIIAIAVCAAVFVFCRIFPIRERKDREVSARQSLRPLWHSPGMSSLSRFPLDSATALLVGVPVLVLVGAIVSSTLIAPNFSDRNYLVLSPFIWGFFARLYDAAATGAPRLVRVALNLTLSVLVLSMASIVGQRLPPGRPALAYEPFRESAQWIRSIPECRGQIVPVITMDHKAWYKPGHAAIVYASAYGRYLQDFSRPQLIFMEEILAHSVPTDLQVELQRRMDGDSCPILAWSVHYITVEAIAVAKNELLKSVDRPVAEKVVKTKEFPDGQVGFVLYLDRKRGP